MNNRQHAASGWCHDTSSAPPLRLPVLLARVVLQVTEWPELLCTTLTRFTERSTLHWCAVQHQVLDTVQH